MIDVGLPGRRNGHVLIGEDPLVGRSLRHHFEVGSFEVRGAPRGHQAVAEDVLRLDDAASSSASAGALPVLAVAQRRAFGPVRRFVGRLGGGRGGTIQAEKIKSILIKGEKPSSALNLFFKCDSDFLISSHPANITACKFQFKSYMLR